MDERTVIVLPILRKALADNYSRERDGIHVSDLVLCPRQSVFRKIDPKPLSDVELMFFSLGASHHAAVQALMKSLGEERVQIEKKIKYKDITGSIDLVIDGIPTEIKTQRTKTHSVKSHYTSQLKCYMAMLGSEIGKIITIGLINYEKPFEEFDINMQEWELEEQRMWLEIEAKQYKIALDSKKPLLARHVIGSELEWKCSSCPFRKECWTSEGYKVRQTFEKNAWKETYYKE